MQHSSLSVSLCIGSLTESTIVPLGFEAVSFWRIV